MAGHSDDDFDRDILDIIPERFDADADSYHARAGSRLRNWLILGAAVLAVGVAVAVGWRVVAGGGDSANGIPVISADQRPIKIRPDDRGGMQVPNQDKLVYGRLEQGDGDAKVERLLPAAEQPVPPPAAPVAPPKPVAPVAPEVLKPAIPAAPVQAPAPAVVRPVEPMPPAPVAAPAPAKVASAPLPAPAPAPAPVKAAPVVAPAPPPPVPGAGGQTGGFGRWGLSGAIGGVAFRPRCRKGMGPHPAQQCRCTRGTEVRRGAGGFGRQGCVLALARWSAERAIRPSGVWRTEES